MNTQLTTRKQRRELAQRRSKPQHLMAVMKADDTGRFKTGEELDALCPLRHFFCNGIYAREFTLPKGFVVVGKIHKYDNLLVISKGDVSIWGENGLIRVQAPYICVSPAGVQRIVYGHEETIFTTFHRTDETDPSKMVDEIATESEEDYRDFVKRIGEKS